MSVCNQPVMLSICDFSFNHQSVMLSICDFSFNRQPVLSICDFSFNRQPVMLSICDFSFNRRRSGGGERLTPRLLLIEALRDVDQENAYKMTIQRHQSGKTQIPTTPTTPLPPPPPPVHGHAIYDRGRSFSEDEDMAMVTSANYQCYCSNGELQAVYKLIRDAKMARAQQDLSPDAHGGAAVELLVRDPPDVCDYGVGQQRPTAQIYGVTIANDSVGTPERRPQPTGGCDGQTPLELGLQ